MLKAATTLLAAMGMVLFAGFFWILQARPTNGDHRAMEKYSVLLGGYLMLTIFCFIAAAFCAILLVRKVRHEYQTQSRENLDMLVETAMYSHKKKTDADDK